MDSQTRPWTAGLLLLLAGCTSTPERPAQSTVGCAEAVVAALPAGLTDPEKHCLAAAGVSRRCSPIESWLAGWGKEFRDAFDAGDADWQDLRADRSGRHCTARTHDNDEALLECCRTSLAPTHR